jgi:hypothetical protein
VNNGKTNIATAFDDPSGDSYGVAGSSTDRAAAKFLAVELDRLMSLPLDTFESIRRWDIEAKEVMAALDIHFPCFLIEQQSRHFFADAGLRQKDAAYRQQQHQYIADYVKRLRNGHLQCQPSH